MYPGLRGCLVRSHPGSERAQCRQIPRRRLKETGGQRELAGVASHPVPTGSRGQASVAALLCLLKSQTLGKARCRRPLPAHYDTCPRRAIQVTTHSLAESRCRAREGGGVSTNLSAVRSRTLGHVPAPRARERPRVAFLPPVPC